MYMTFGIEPENSPSLSFFFGGGIVQTKALIGIYINIITCICDAGEKFEKFETQNGFL